MRTVPVNRSLQQSLRLLLSAILVMVLVPQANSRSRPRGWLVIDSPVDGARVYVDGRLVGKTPFKRPLKLRPGKHRLKATKAGFGTFKTEFRIRRGRRTEISVDLLPVSGLLKVTANIDAAEVYIDNKLAGRTPLIKNVVVGKHDIMVMREGYNDYVSEIVVEAGQRHFVEAVLTPFQDLSPEVKAIAEQQKQKQKLLEQLGDRLAEKPLPPAEQQPAAAPWYQDWWRKWWFWTAAGVVLATAVVIPVAVTAGSSQANLNAHPPAATIQLQLRQP
ncbi:MAG: hypothetical protein DRI34_00365 [Deltaproteobacteria bacterium]|nr:MAG: hypothetical protein DRI34_00365 [Deltaproteobacteria bacterium]